MLEKTVVAKVVATARSLGWWTAKMHGNAFSVQGLPDVLAIKDGRVCWLECKTPGNRPTRIQEHRMRELTEYGCPVAVVTSGGEARAFLESVG